MSVRPSLTLIIDAVDALGVIGVGGGANDKKLGEMVIYGEICLNKTLFPIFTPICRDGFRISVRGGQKF